MRTFKKRLSSHKYSFKNPNRKNETTLSKYVWSLIEKDLDNAVDLLTADPYWRGIKAGQLCLMEKHSLRQTTIKIV